MFIVFSRFRVSLLISNQFPIYDKSSLYWCKLCSFCFTAVHMYKYVFTEIEIVSKSFIIKMNSIDPSTDHCGTHLKIQLKYKANNALDNKLPH